VAKSSSWVEDKPKFTSTEPLVQEVLGEIHQISSMLAKRRAELGLSAKTVGVWAGVTRQTVAALEDGSSWPDLLTVLKIAAVLGIRLQAQVVPGSSLGPRRPSSLYRGR
jgi:DNA-binding XRE family transcriptional regulator